MKKIITTLLIICLLASCTTKDRRVAMRPCVVLDKHTHFIPRGRSYNCLYIYDGEEAQHYSAYDSSYYKLNIGDTLTIIQLITIHQ